MKIKKHVRLAEALEDLRGIMASLEQRESVLRGRRASVPDDLTLEIELETDEGGTELEIELKWRPTAQTPKDNPLIGILMGSERDRPVMEEAAAVLQESAVPYEIRVLSAHRTPDKVIEYAKSAPERGLEIIIAGAGMAAHLAGLVAANTCLPVIGVPIKSEVLGGIDALLSTVQMPTGIPVATVGINGARNAAYLALAMLGPKYPQISKRLRDIREGFRREG